MCGEGVDELLRGARRGGGGRHGRRRGSVSVVGRKWAVWPEPV